MLTLRDLEKLKSSPLLVFFKIFEPLTGLKKTLLKGADLSGMGNDGFDIDWFYGAHGHRLRYGRLDGSDTGANKVVLLLNGRSEFLEKYVEVAEELVSRGYTVLSFDWRGQGLSVRELENRQKGYVKTFEDYLADLAVFYRQIVIPLDSPVTLLAHSMGGHLGLRFMHDNPHAFSRAVLVSPMIDIVTLPFPSFAARRIAKIACAAGFGEAYVLGGTNYAPGKVCFDTNRLTHDLERFNHEERLIAQIPDLALGDVTYAWLKAAFDSIQLLKVKSYAGQIGTPVMLVSADEDRVVSIAAQRRMARDLPDCRLVCLPNARHEILHETDGIRRAFWKHFDAFTA